MKNLTIVDIAREAGVSIKSVSRVLNHEYGVSAATRTRIQAVIDAHGFRPNAAARSLPGSRSYLVGLMIYRDDIHYYYSALQTGIMRAARRHGYHMVTEPMNDYDREDRLVVLRRLSASRFDAMVVPPPMCDDPAILDMLEELDIPYVRIAPRVQLERSSYIYMNDSQAAYEAIDHLWQLGHRDILYVGFRETGASEDRYHGYTRYFRDKNLVPPFPLMEVASASAKGAIATGEAIMTSKNRPTAIFAGSDMIAFGLMTAASKNGLNVPGDVSIVGFDDSPGAETVWPPLTTIRQPITEMGERAMDSIVKALGGDLAVKAKEAQMLDFSLVVRGTTGPPARTKM
ncbi:MAG: LacI family DNA-binding transcriptional regulator [Asticcacaulis sp.]|nr:LacI family DNA-binding transcriptional regulator [Asticcacaulis sp.]